MNLDFSDDQKLLQEEAKKFLTKEDALKINRAVMDSDKTYDQDLWNKIVELGWTGIRTVSYTHLTLPTIYSV